MGEWELGIGLVWLIAALWAITRLPNPSDARSALPTDSPPAGAVRDTPSDARIDSGWPPGVRPPLWALARGLRAPPFPTSP